MERAENLYSPEQSAPEAVQPRSVKKKPKISASKIIIFIILVLYTFSLFFPMYTIVVSSFTSIMESSATTQFVWFPKKPTFGSYIDVLSKDVYIDILGIPSLLQGFWNTLWMTLLPLIVGLLVSGLSAYAYTKMQFPGKEKLFNFAFILSMIPLGAFGVISYTFYSMIGWTGTPLPLIIPGMLGSMGTVFFLKMYYEGIPDSYIEAARMDGLGSIGSFFVIVFPLAAPAFIAQFIFGFVGGYNNYLGLMLSGVSAGFLTYDIAALIIPDGWTGYIGGKESMGLTLMRLVYWFIQNEQLTSSAVSSASVISWVLFVVTATLSIILFRQREKSMEG